MYFKVARSSCTNEDLLRFAECVAQVKPRETFFRDDLQAPQWMPSKAVAIAENEGYIFIENDVAVGYFFIATFAGDATTRYLHGAFISYAQRGKGYCCAMLEPVMQELRERGMSIVLNVRLDNIAAVWCYHKLGFRECHDPRFRQKHCYTQMRLDPFVE
eukprot:ANDGO_08404.mRNA.1 hypothetical protein